MLLDGIGPELIAGPRSIRGISCVRPAEIQRGERHEQDNDGRPQATDIYSTARENPYVQRLIEDDELRDSLRTPSKPPRRLRPRDRQRQGPGQGRDQRQEGPEGPARGRREPARGLRAAAGAEEAQESRLGRLILFGLVGAAIALVLSEDARKTVLDALFGAEEEFEYTSTTSINGS